MNIYKQINWYWTSRKLNWSAFNSVDVYNCSLFKFCCLNNYVRQHKSKLITVKCFFKLENCIVTNIAFWQFKNHFTCDIRRYNNNNYSNTGSDNNMKSQRQQQRLIHKRRRQYRWRWTVKSARANCQYCWSRLVWKNNETT